MAKSETLELVDRLVEQAAGRAMASGHANAAAEDAMNARKETAEANRQRGLAEAELTYARQTITRLQDALDSAILLAGTIEAAGGGLVTILVDRDTETYPDLGAAVTVRRL